MRKKIYKSICIGQHVFPHLEDYAKKYFQNNLSMTLTYLASKQLEELGYNINYDSQINEYHKNNNKKVDKHMDNKSKEPEDKIAISKGELIDIIEYVLSKGKKKS